MDSNKTFKKTLFFYSINTRTIPLCQDNNKFTTEYFLQKAFKENECYIIDKNKIIEIYEFKENFLFGSIGKFETPEKLALKRQRNIIDFDSKPVNLENSNSMLEDFTFFYIGNNFKNIVVLKNDSAPKINPCFRKHFRSLCPELDDICIYEQQIEDIEAQLRKFTDFLKISFAFDANKVPNILPSIRELKYLSENELEKISINLDIKKDVADESFIKELASNDYSHFINYKISGLTTDDTLEQTIDLLKRVLTKKVIIDITPNHIKDKNKIKIILEQELLKSIKRNNK